jgi:putative phage-type endonuclease
MTTQSFALPQARLVLPYSAPREEWLEARRQGIGGSDALACLGLDPWRTRMEVYLDKLGQAPEREQTDRMRWGQLLEPTILAWFTERTGIPVRRRGLVQSRQRPWQMVSLDAITADGGIAEIKNTNFFRRDEWADDQVADGAEAQSQHGLAVTGRSHAWVIAQIAGEPPVIRRVERDEDLIADITAMEHELWQMVQAKTPPALEGKASERLVSRLFPHGLDGDPYVATAEFLDLRKQYLAALAEEKDAGRRKAEIGARMKLLMGTATRAVDEHGQMVAAWGNRSKTTTDVAALRERWPDIADQVLSETPYRQLDAKPRYTPKPQPKSKADKAA